jgi:hypothetical protein
VRVVGQCPCRNGVVVDKLPEEAERVALYEAAKTEFARLDFECIGLVVERDVLIQTAVLVKQSKGRFDAMNQGLPLLVREALVVDPCILGPGESSDEH